LMFECDFQTYDIPKIQATFSVQSQN
jgi:hypothetical protein